MFKTAATKFAHNSTIPALAGNSDLRQFQDLINAEKVVLVSIQRLGVDLTKAAESLRAWGVGEGDDLVLHEMTRMFCDTQRRVDELLILSRGAEYSTCVCPDLTVHFIQDQWLHDILSASTTLLVNFSAALSTYASTHHGIRDTMKSVRTREEALDDLRRRRRRVGTSADSAEKKLNKMSPEHKNLSAQTDALNRLREEMRAMDGEIVREEAELGDFKRRCAKSWMQAKFGGLAECCEKGVIVGDIGKAIVAEIPEDVTQPGLPRAYYSAHTRVSTLVSEAQRGIAQIAFTAAPSTRVGQGDYEHTSSTQTSPRITQQSLFSGSPYLPAPRVGSGLNMGGFGGESLSLPNQNQRTESADELGVSTPTSTHTNHFASVPARGSSLGVLLHDGPIPSTPTSSFSRQPDAVSGNPSALPVHDTGSLTGSIADALSRSDSNPFGPNRPSVDDPVPQYEPFVPGSGAPYTGVGDTRRSKSPSLPPGAAPAAIQAWDGGLGTEIEEQRAMSESNDHATSVMSVSGNEQTMSITGLSDRRTSQESVGGMPYDRDEEPEDFQQREIALQRVDRRAKFGAEDEAEAEGSRPSHGRTESQRRIPRVPPPPVDTEVPTPPERTRIASPLLQQPTSPLQTQAKGHAEDDGDDEHARNAAAAREVSRELDALAFSAPASVTYSTHPTQSRAPPQGSYMSGQAYPHQPYQQLQIHAPQQVPNQLPQPPSPLAPPNAPFAHRSVSPHPQISVDPTESRPLPNIVASRSSSPRATSPRLPPSSLSSVQSPASIPYRSPPEYQRPQPPFSSPLMAKSTSSLTSGGAPRMISAAAFRRPGRNGSESGSTLTPTGYGPADTSPLSLHRPSASPASSMSRKSGAMRRLSVINPDPVQTDEDEFDYISAYTGGDESGGAHAQQSGGYGQGRYVSDLETR